MATPETVRVLIVEDETDVARLMASVLEDEGYEVMTYDSGDCFAAVASFNPHVILCDYMLPVYDGGTVARRLRAGIAPHVPLIMVSAVGPACARWREWGADDFLSKPFDIDRLIAVVHRAAGADGKLWSRAGKAAHSDDRAS